MASPQNRRNTRVGSPRSSAYASGTLPENNTSRKNYTALRYGNDHGSINFGHIHKQAECVSDILLQASDGRHSICLDKDGQRKASTQIVAPGRISIESGEDLKETESAMLIHCVNGDMLILATKGKLRLQCKDVEIVVVGDNGSKGNVVIRSTESILLDSKKVLTNASSLCKIVSSGKVEMAANSCMKIYASIAKISTDASANRDSKVGTKRFQQQNTKI